MLVIRVLWLQASLAMAQLVDLNGILGGGDGSGSSAVEEQGAAETGSSGGLLGGLAGDAAAGAGGLLDPILDPIVGPSGLLGNNEAVATSVEAPTATSADPVPNVEPTAVVSPTESPAPGPTPEPTSEPAVEPTPEASPEPLPTTEQAQPAPATNQPAEQQPQLPTSVPALELEASAEPAPATTAAAAAPVPSPANQGLIQAPSEAASPAPAPSPSAGTEAAVAAPAATTANASPPAEQQPSPSGEPMLIPETASGSAGMSVFVPPSPTGAVAAIDGVNNLSSDPGSNTDPFQTTPNPNTLEDSSENTATGLDGAAGTANTTRTGTNSNPNALSSDSDIPLPTKIGIGVGVGAGTILLVVVITVFLWKRRMARHGPPSYDGERGTSPTPQDKAKMDFESEHDVAFDFGGFFRDRARGAPAAGGGPGHGSQGSVGSLGSFNSMRGRGYGADGKGDDRLPAFEMPSQGQMQMSQVPQQQSQVVAELDGGAVPLYRGTVGVGR